MMVLAASVVSARGERLLVGCAREASLLGGEHPCGVSPPSCAWRLLRGFPSRRRHRRIVIHRALGAGVFALAIAVVTVLVSTAPARAQGPPIQEMERLLDQRESAIAVTSARLERLESVGDSLVNAKRRADPGGVQYERISNQIRENSDQIKPLQRDLRILHGEAGDIRQQLYQRYNTAVAETNTRIQELRRQGRTPQNSAELRRLVDDLPTLLAARERHTAALEEERCAPWLPDLVLLADDGPAQLRYKEALARDAVDKIDTCIQGIQTQITKIAQRERIREETDRIRRDIELWGDDRSARAADNIGQILEGRGAGASRAGIGDPFEDPNARIRELNRRRLDLVERRQEFEAKARWFAQRLREF